MIYFHENVHSSADKASRPVHVGFVFLKNTTHISSSSSSYVRCPLHFDAEDSISWIICAAQECCIYKKLRSSFFFVVFSTRIEIQRQFSEAHQNVDRLCYLWSFHSVKLLSTISESGVIRRGGRSSPARTVEYCGGNRPLLCLLGLGGLKVCSVIGALYFLDHLLHLLALLLPLLLRHVLFLVEHALIGLPVAATESVPEGGVLAVVVVEGQVMNGVASSAVDHRIVTHELAVVNQDGPKVDEHEQEDKGNLLEGKQEGEDVVRQTLSGTIEGVEGVGGKWSRHNPLVVRLMQAFIDERMVQPTVDPVNAEVGEHEE